MIHEAILCVLQLETLSPSPWSFEARLRTDAEDCAIYLSANLNHEKSRCQHAGRDGPIL